MLRTLGATRRQIVVILAAEYAAFGLLAVAIASGLALAAGLVLTRFVFESAFAVPWTALSSLGLSVMALTLGIGLSASGPVFRETPLEVLRAE